MGSVSGTSYASYYDLFTIGAGYLDVWGALNSTDIIPANASAVSPIAPFNGTNGAVTLVTASNVVWGSNVVDLKKCARPGPQPSPGRAK